MTAETMTPEQIEVLANELRALIQDRTCCPYHAGEVLLHVMAGFALDDADDNEHKAAQQLMKTAKMWANMLRTGHFKMVRGLQ